MKKVSAAALSWLVVGTSWYVAPSDAKKADGALANGNVKEQETSANSIEDSSLAATPNAVAERKSNPKSVN